MISVMAVKLNHQAGDTAVLTVLMLSCAMTVIWVSCHDIPNSSKNNTRGYVTLYVQEKPSLAIRMNQIQ